MPARDPADQPNPSVFEPHQTHICGANICLTTVDYTARPEREIAANLLEELGDWLTALQQVQAPPRVLFALRATHDAACWWTADLDKPRPVEEKTDAPA